MLMSDLKTELAALKIRPDQRQSGGRGATLIVIAILLLAGAGAAAWWYTSENAMVVEAATVESRTTGQAAGAVLNASGYVTARRRATVSSKMTGKVVEVNVEEGMRVRQGQVLARLDDSQIRAAYELSQAQLGAARTAVDELEVRLREAQLTLGRREQLRREGVVGQADLDAAQAEVDSLRARIASARQQEEVAARQVALQKTQLDDTVIRAPFSGVAISKDAQPGEMVSPVSAGGGFTRTGISTIVDMSSLEIEVEVNETYINRVRPDQKATAVLDAYPDWEIPAHVIATIPAADRQKATVLVRLGFGPPVPAELLPRATRETGHESRILPDMGVKVAFHGAEQSQDSAAQQPRERTVLPRTAVRESGEAREVLVITPGGRVERRAVRVGAEDGDRLEIVSGVTAGERVVNSPPADLRDGAKVRVKS
jgi:RND family efflux transporter MFP subunit